MGEVAPSAPTSKCFWWHHCGPQGLKSGRALDQMPSSHFESEIFSINRNTEFCAARCDFKTNQNTNPSNNNIKKNGPIEVQWFCVFVRGIERALFFNRRNVRPKIRCRMCNVGTVALLRQTKEVTFGPQSVLWLCIFLHYIYEWVYAYNDRPLHLLSGK